MTWQLGFLRLSNIHCISQPIGLGLCQGSLCSLNSSFQAVLQHKTGQEPATNTSAWFTLPRISPCCCSTLWWCRSTQAAQKVTGRGQVFPAFFCRNLPWQIFLVVLRQLFGIVKTLYGEIRSSCSTVNSGTLTGIVYVIQVEKPCLCHEGCSLSFLT